MKNRRHWQNKGKYGERRKKRRDKNWKTWNVLVLSSCVLKDF